MKKIMLFLFLSRLCWANLPSDNFSILMEKLDYIHSKDAKIAIKIWLNELAVGKYDKEIKMNFYEQRGLALESFINGTIETLTLNTIIYLEEQKRLEPYIKNLYAFLPTKDTAIRYFLVVPAKKNIKSIKDLKKGVIGVRGDEFLGKLYLDYLLLENKLSPSKKYFSDIHSFKNNSRVLMKLFFKKLDSCVVPEHIWNIMVEMNPQIAKKLKILDKSRKIFIPTLTMISKNIDARLYQVFSNSVSGLKGTPTGSQLLALLKMHEYKYIDKGVLDPLLNYYQEYLELKKRNSGK